ncbi:hypothetical protein LOZ66_006227 [Ophidiomyces ophidiicola]|nr:hypothetical protein LOZ66_006227 [Ophidiomyces ophidiicola]
MASLSPFIRNLFRRPPSPARNFPSVGFKRIDDSQKTEEEKLPDYVAERYYPVRTGEVSASKYQVVGKFGFGTTSTAWLACDLGQHRYVTITIFVRSQSLATDVKR